MKKKVFANNEAILVANSDWLHFQWCNQATLQVLK